MLSRPIRVVGHVGAVAFLTGATFFAVGGSGSASTPSRPDSYGGDATASAIHVQFNRTPGLFPAVDNPINDDMPYASTSIDSSGGDNATAAPYTPGQGVLGVPALLCVFAGPVCSKVTPPDYPFMAYAQYPSNKDAKATVAPGTIQQGPAQVTLGKTTAHADPNLVEATTDAGGAGVTKVMSADDATAHSMQHFVGTTLVASTESAVNGLDIGGKLHIDSVRSVATAKVDGGKVSAARATTTITGATVAGVPVVIDTHGIHVDGHSDGGAVVDKVNTALKALAAQGIHARQLDTTRTVRHGAAAATTGGLLVTFTHTVNAPTPPSLPKVPQPPSPNGDYFGTITIAGAGVRTFATPAIPLPPFVSTAAVPPPAAKAGHSTAGGGGTAAVPPSAGSAGSTAPSGGNTPVVAPKAPSHPTRLLGLDLTGKRMKTLALVLLAYPLVMLLGRPLRAPARLPGG